MLHMKLPSILKTPTNKRFTIQPRYYDPVKEDIENRTDRIKKIHELKKNENLKDGDQYDSSIHGAFGKDSYYKQKGMGALRFSIMVFLSAGAVGYYAYGNVSLYVMMVLAAAFYLYRKMRSA